ncbi:8-oxo-dGTP pyrophosphatase MutT, NUDIX family [Tranquillimonas rosea]|uniref:8-oxo-dGTP pyrophosphatase MutT, NUDIX family n=1 Tax=Tranquillimonas rosea TaxID=641238 RepID=A0A1H9UGT2_9RHOB|nr:CoA pyrophosphatase [Tranquillimonas rosea]SES08646.1 8-oxo-dGTP pyrophosphatase MutT, NUDIX family [Tranquillimonas rosea]
MTTDDIRARIADRLAAPGRPSSDFDLNTEGAGPGQHALRGAGVLVPLHAQDGAVRVILTKRSSALKHHPGQIAFPGGKIEPGDGDAATAALREAEEEIGLPRERVTLLGTLPPHETVTRFTMTPLVGWIEGPFDPVPEAGEVAEVFSVPLSHATEPARFRVEGRRWQGRRRYYYAVPWGPYYIWGATARILRGFAEAMR